MWSPTVAPSNGRSLVRVGVGLASSGAATAAPDSRRLRGRTTSGEVWPAVDCNAPVVSKVVSRASDDTGCVPNLDGRRCEEAGELSRLPGRVASVRGSRGWTQSDLGARVGFHWSAIGAIERGQRNVTLTTLLHLGAALPSAAAAQVRCSLTVRCHHVDARAHRGRAGEKHRFPSASSTTGLRTYDRSRRGRHGL